MRWTQEARDGRARAGRLETDHGVVETPAFMPVGTVGSIKGIETRELADYGARIALANAYHLYLRPGTRTLEAMGGLHRFMVWDKSILVDSGGFQVFSLADLRKVTEEGVRFRSHIDGSPHMFTPEKVVEIQRSIGPDLVMPLDELVGWPAEREVADAAAERTWRWLQRGMEHFEKTKPLYGHGQTLVPIVQGSFYPELREREAARYAALEHPIYAIGGLAVGEEVPLTRQATEIVTEILPEASPRYAMGVGLPQDLVESARRGVDLFDCVVPTRNGRRGTLFTFQGRRNMRNERYSTDERPVERGCPCPVCSHYSRAYLRHLFVANEYLAPKLGSAHNLVFYFRLMEQIREHIRAGDLDAWAEGVVPRLSGRAED